MESIAHSRQPNKVSSTLSKKITNGNHGGLSAKGLYDDVYGGPPKFGVNSLSPRFEDYSEIFGSFHTARASSIPVLDLPMVDESEVFFDARSPAFDYSEVFGGFNGVDFAVSFDDLFHQPNVHDGVSSEEAWTPAETDSFSEESDHSGNNISTSNGDPYQSVGGGTEFNISYHKVNGTSNGDLLKAKTHTSDLQAVQGFTLMFDDAAPMPRVDPSLQHPDDINVGMGINADRVRVKHHRKAIPHPFNRTSGEQTFVDDHILHGGYSRSGSHSAETFVTVTDISLKTQPSQVPPPSRPPPLLDVKKGDTSDFPSHTEQIPSKGASGDSSPPFFDVQVDMNSSAAASAAAMKEVMHRAEAKLRSAKELKERKKESSESHVKSSYNVSNSEGKTRSSSLKDETIQGTSCDKRCSKVKNSVTDERQKAMKVVVQTPDSLEEERLLHMFEKSAEEKLINESRSSQGSDKSTQAGTWKEATGFFELVGTEESPNVFQPLNHNKSLVQDARIREHGWKASLQEESKNVKAIEANCQVGEYEKKSKAAKEAHEQDKSIRRSKATHEEHKQREHVKKEKVAKFSEQEENGNARMVHQHGKAEKKIANVDQSGSLEKMSQTQQREIKQMEGEKHKEVDRLNKVNQVRRLKENEKMLKEAENPREGVKMHKQTEKVKETDKRGREVFALGQAEGEGKLLESDGRLKEAICNDKKGKESWQRENEKRLKQVEQIQNKKGFKGAGEREEAEKKLKDSISKEGHESPKQALDQEKSEKRLKESFELEVNDVRVKGAFEQGKNDKRVKEAYKRNSNKKAFEEYWDGYEIEIGLQEADDFNGQKVLNQSSEQDRNSRILKEAQREEEIESPANHEFNREGNGVISNEDSYQEHSEMILNGADGREKDKGLDEELEQMEGNEDVKILKFAKEIDGIWKTECGPNHPASQSAFNHENIGNLEELLELNVAGRVIGLTGAQFKVEKNLEEVGMDNLVANKNNGDPEMTPGDPEHSWSHSGKVDDIMTHDDEVDYGNKQTGIEKTKTVSQQDIDSRNQERQFANEWGERGKNNQHVKIVPSQEESEDQATSSYANLSDHNRRNTEAAEPATEQETVSAQKSAPQLHVGQSTERKAENLSETIASEEQDDERMEKEGQLEKDRLRKIEEERQREREKEKDRMAADKAMLEAEREREREKDRMAVDRATLLARDRAFAEAREKAEKAAFERATAEARQRALTEARERLEKACAEARDKSFADKASIEVRLRAERAAVERATAEARERAMERAKVERATFESRGRLERSVSDNFGPSAGSRQPYSSMQSTCSFTERSEGGEGESAQRYRARLERYRRTAERAAKALAEKNMRDLQAQKEQAERNRLAETLDAEVRRWSSGKEGNLRALLSTLQYILGPDSGWQPVPLTEVITSAAVKKAYRKATLCVHPDKLQQRGASIQHKYICEKVFDLLKEAWNKFNSEER